MAKIITHPGQAHLDDFIACSLVMANDPKVRILHRRNPTEDELNDPKVYCIDVGMRYEPELNNFDHHQEDDNLPEGKSSASLVAAHLGIDTSLFPWWEGVDRMDCTGPFQTANWIGTTWDDLRKVQSPISTFMLREFAQPTDFNGKPIKMEHINFSKGWWLWEFMVQFGFDIIERAEWISKRLAELDMLCEVWEIAGLKWVVMLDESGAPGIEMWCERNHPDAAGTVTVDERGPGLCLYRRNDHPAVNFTRCKAPHFDEGLVEFIHKNGFVIKLKPRSVFYATEAIKLATERP